MANNPSYTDAELALELRTVIKDTEDSHRRRKSAGTITSGQSAGILERLRAGAARLEQLASLTPLQHQFFNLLLIIPSPCPKAKHFASAEQQAEIKELLKDPAITKGERSKMLANINKLEGKRADEAIEKLKKAITDRTDKPAPEGHPALASDGYQQAYDEYNDLLNHELINPEERRKARLTIGSCDEATLRLYAAQTRNRITKRQNDQTAVAA